MPRRFLLFLIVALLLATPAVLPAAPFAEIAARDAALRDVVFLDARHGFAVGDRGVALRTDDGGRSWTLLETPTAAPLCSVSFLDRMNGWAVGGVGKPYSSATRGVVLRTRDGGVTWEPLPTDTLPLLRWVKFFDTKNGVAVGAGGAFQPSGVFVTADGGRGWQPLPADQPRHWRAADFVAQGLGVVVSARGAAGMVAQREVRPIGATAGDRRGFNAVELTGQTGGWMVGDGGGVLTTLDGGRSWRPPDGPLPPALGDRFDGLGVATRGNQVWIVGSPGSVVLHSGDRGKSWRLRPTGVSTPLHAVAFVDERRGWAVGDLGVVLATDDGGDTWRIQRHGAERVALDVLVAGRPDTPAELVTKHGVAEGYVVSLGVAFGEETGKAFADSATAAREAAVVAGAAGAATGWRLALSRDERRLPTDELLDRLNNKTDGRALDELHCWLVARLRALRPSAVAVVEPRDSSSPGATALLNEAVQRAVSAAAEPATLPELLEIGLKPWRVDRVVELTPDGLRSTGGFATGDFEPQLGTSIAQWSAPARRLTRDTHTAPSSRVGWRAVAGRPAGEGRRGDLLAGLGLPRGGVARRPAATPPTGNLDRLRAAAHKRRNLEQLLARREGDSAWSGQVMNLTGGLDADSGASLLFQLAVGYRDAGKLDLAANTFFLLAKRYGDHPLTEPALEWVLRYYASSETAVHAAANARGVREPRPLANVAAGAGRAGLDAFDDDTPGVLTDDDRFERATRLGAYLRDARPASYADPAIRFSVAAAKRRLGYGKDAKRILLLLSKQAVDPAWRRAAEAERWLAEPTELPPEKPVAVCKSVATRPRLDGELDDACWAGAERVLLKAGDPGAGVGELRFVRDEEFLYLAVDCPKLPGVDYPSAEGRRPRDGELIEHDRVTVRLDTDRDYSTAFELTIDARGWPGDRLAIGDGWRTKRWEPTWYLAAAQDDKHWRAEAAVPLAAVASPLPTPRDAWAVGVTRLRPGSGGAHATWTGAGPGSPDHLGLMLMR